MRWAVLLVVSGCGRIGFGSLDDAGGTVVDGPPFLSDVVPPDSPLPSGLVAWLPFDNASAQGTPDVVSGITGRCGPSLCPTSTPGHHGTAFLFDGMDDCIEIPDLGQFNQAKVTVAIWARQDIVDNCSAFAKRVDVGSNTLDTWQVETSTNNDVTLTSNHGATFNLKITSASGALTLGMFHHLAATYDGLYRYLYVDGVRVATGNGPSTGPNYDTHSLWIGCDDNGSTFPLHWNGALDDFQLYDRALDVTEIQALAAM